MNSEYMKKNPDDVVIFDSDFESGNLDLAIEQNNEYDLFVKVDSNTKGHC
jgi:hypothetical protein